MVDTMFQVLRLAITTVRLAKSKRLYQQKGTNQVKNLLKSADSRDDPMLSVSLENDKKKRHLRLSQYHQREEASMENVIIQEKLFVRTAKDVWWYQYSVHS